MKVAVLVSGGVDSAVALARLRDRRPDLELTAFYLRIWLEDELAFLGDCPWEEDLGYVRATCTMLDVPLEVIPLQQQYHQRVVAKAIAELERGRTPSPDLHCNAEIKFGAFLDAVGDGFDAVATGHYAQAIDGTLRLAADPKKDQTYFLSRLSPAQIARARFPIGDTLKPAVRAEAIARALPSAARPDSQGICFLGKIPYPEFVRAHLGDRPGAIVDIDGKTTLGEHRGLWFHTIGQRQGLGLGGGPWFVVAKDLSQNQLQVAHASRLAEHQRSDFEVEDLNWITRGTVETVKLRHGPRRERCTFDGQRVRLAEPEPGIAPGQYAVFYEGDVCLGSGVIR